MFLLHACFRPFWMFFEASTRWRKFTSVYCAFAHIFELIILIFISNTVLFNPNYYGQFKLLARNNLIYVKLSAKHFYFQKILKTFIYVGLNPSSKSMLK